LAKLRLNETPGTSLIVSFLIRYPELSSLRFTPESGVMAFTILLKGEVSVEQQSQFESHVHTSMAVCMEFSRAITAPGTVSHSLMDGVTILTYEQEVATLSILEIRLFMQLASDFYNSMLGEDVYPLPEEDLEMQERLIEQILLKKETWREEKPIVAYRDGGKVFVYNK